MAITGRRDIAPRDRDHRMFAELEGQANRSGRTLSTILFAVALFLFVGFLSAWQVSAEKNARGPLASGIALTTDLDALMQQNVEALRRQVAADSEEVYVLPEYPIDVYVTAEEVEALEDAQLRELILDRSAAVVYRDGLDAFDRTG